MAGKIIKEAREIPEPREPFAETCDGPCPSRAYHRVELPSGRRLYACDHHIREWRAKLSEIGASVAS